MMYIIPQVTKTISTLKCGAKNKRALCRLVNRRRMPLLQRPLSSTPSRWTQNEGGWGRGKVLAIRREESNVWERRAPLNPSHVQSLVREGVKVIVFSMHVCMIGTACTCAMYMHVHVHVVYMKILIKLIYY